MARFRERCELLTRFGARAAAHACTDDLIGRFPGQNALVIDRAALDLADGLDSEKALEQLRSVGFGASLEAAAVLIESGREREALSLLAREAPQMVADAPVPVYAGSAQLALFAGVALLGNGQTARGRERLHQVVAVLAAHPFDPTFDDWCWIDVWAQVALAQVMPADAASSTAAAPAESSLPLRISASSASRRS